MRLACSTACFPQDRLELAVTKVAWAGYRAVELALDAEPLPAEETLRERLRAEELELAAVFAGPLPAAGQAPEELARIGRAATLTRALDGALLVFEPPRDGTLDTVSEALKLLDRALGGVAVDLCVVNRHESLLARPADLRDLWARSLPERAGLALDPAHALLAGWDPAELDALPELPRHVYLNDAAEGRIVPPGEGTLDLPRLGSELRLRGYAGAISLVLANADPWAVEPLVMELRQSAAGWFLS